MIDVTIDAESRDNRAPSRGGESAAPATTQLPPIEEAALRSGWSKGLRFLETARHLKAKQALFWAIRRSCGRHFRIPALPEFEVRDNVRLKSELVFATADMADDEFEFLNVRERFDGQIDWRTSSQSKLWQYNLHYFDYALDAYRSSDWVRAAMEDWVRRNPPAKSVGWEPYPLSLRIVNWIKFDLRPGQVGRLPPSCRQSLCEQLGWLERNLEHEIQANHLLKNAKALLFGGAYFSGRVADRWLRKGSERFLEQIEEQIRADGGHYERSAMYHAIVLQDMLDVLNLVFGSTGLMSGRAVTRLVRHADNALSYLQDLTYPTGQLPMFNDSVAGIAPDVAYLRSFARAILPHVDTRAARDTALINKASTGFYGYRHGTEMLLIDGGAPSPSYQPGHSHCGLLGFELVVAGCPVIVDSGVYDYEPTPLRHLLRSTVAHNTVRIDRDEQSDIWGAFRMGRRARPGRISLSADLPNRFRFTGAHDGYRHRSGRPVHRRVIECRIGHRWQILDEITGGGTHLLESFLHFHPGLRLEGQGDAWVATCQDSGLRFRITSAGGICQLGPSTYCPGFGVRQSNWMLALRAEAALPAQLIYTIEKV